jgi:hypothetical protein
MNKKPGFSKILELERDLRFHKQNKPLIKKKHFDMGHSINLSYDDSFNQNVAQQFTVENHFEAEDSEQFDSRQFGNDDYFVDPFSMPVAQSVDDPYQEQYVMQKEEEEEDRYTVTTVESGTSDDGTSYTRKNTESYEDEIAYNERPGGDYSAESAFDQDIRAILAGQKVYNEEQKQLVASRAQNVDDVGVSDDYSTQSSKITDNHNNGLRDQEVSNPHAIFDSMAKSFGTAKSYDLGTLNLDKSFSDIEATIAKREQTIEDKKKVDELNALLYEPNTQQVVDNTVDQKREDLSPQLALDSLDLAENLALLNESARERGFEVVKAFPADKQPTCEADQHTQSLGVTNLSSGLSTDPALNPLLSYLNIPYSRFQPVEAAYFRRLKELLLFHNVIAATDIIDSSNFTEKVKEFQRKVMHDTNPDGVPGENTLFAMQKGWASTRGITLIKSGVRNDAYNGAPLPFRLRSDALPFYNKLYDEVHAQGGVVTSAGSFRDLTASVTAGRSTTSMHYTGLAIDLHTGSGMQNTTGNPYLVERSGTNRWQLWNKVPQPNGQIQNVSAQIYNTTSKTIAPVAVSERVIDFTKIANNNGFKDIGNRSCFPEDYMCAEWWHFQCEEVLVPYISQFGTELLTIYSESELTAHPNIWQNRKKIFKKEWF